MSTRSRAKFSACSEKRAPPKRVEKANLRVSDQPVLGIAFSSDGRTIAIASRDRSIRLLEVGSGRQIAIFKADDQLKMRPFMACSPDGGTLANANFDGTVKLWDALTKQDKAIPSAHTARFRQDEQGNRRCSGLRCAHGGDASPEHQHQARPWRQPQPPQIRLRQQIAAVISLCPILSRLGNRSLIAATCAASCARRRLTPPDIPQDQRCQTCGREVHPRMAFTTLPATSVNRKSRPAWR